MKSDMDDSVTFTPGSLFRGMYADETLNTLFGSEHSVHYKTVADMLSFFTAAKVFGLESELGTESAEGAYFLHLKRHELTEFVKQMHQPENNLVKNFSSNPVWRTIINFSNKWDAEDCLRNGLNGSIWLEADVCGPPPGIPIPSIFYKVESNENSIAAILNGLKACDIELPAAQKELLVSALHVLGPACSTFEVGLLLARPAAPLRLNAFQISPPDITDKLKMLGIDTLAHYADFGQEFLPWSLYYSTVNIDIGAEGFGAKVGLNFNPSADTMLELQRHEFWADFLGWLVGKGWCLAHKRQALLTWNGTRKYHPDPFYFLGGHQIIFRTISHFKLDFRPEQPPRVKAYLHCQVK